MLLSGQSVVFWQYGDGRGGINFESEQVTLVDGEKHKSNVQRLFSQRFGLGAAPQFLQFQFYAGGPLPEGFDDARESTAHHRALEANAQIAGLSFPSGAGSFLCAARILQDPLCIRQ